MKINFFIVIGMLTIGVACKQSDTNSNTSANQPVSTTETAPKVEPSVKEESPKTNENIEEDPDNTPMDYISIDGKSEVSILYDFDKDDVAFLIAKFKNGGKPTKYTILEDHGAGRVFKSEANENMFITSKEGGGVIEVSEGKKVTKYQPKN